MLTLEKYNGPRSRHTCPACGAKRRFTRYIDAQTGRYLSDSVGRCDRQTSCGYHFKPKEYFSGNNESKNLRKPKIRAFHKPSISLSPRRENVSQAFYSNTVETPRPGYIEKRHLIETLSDYDQNAFVRFLLYMFPLDAGAVWQAASEYLLGTKGSRTVFPQIDRAGRIRSAKLIEFDPQTGKRRKERTASWLHSELKRAGQLPGSFKLEQCFFGEHLLSKFPSWPIAIVESEKTAVIASICKGAFPDLIWLASGGKSNLNADKLTRLGTDRRVILFPDADGFEQWQITASEARRRGVNVVVSDLIEKHATREERASGADLADYLIRTQRVKNDLAHDLEEKREERIAIMVYDGELTEEEAEAYLE